MKCGTLTHIGTLRGSPLNNGKTWTCNDPHGLSLSDEELTKVEELAEAGNVRVEAEAVTVRGEG